MSYPFKVHLNYILGQMTQDSKFKVKWLGTDLRFDLERKMSDLQPAHTLQKPINALVLF